MILLGIEGWISGSSATFVVTFGVFFGILSFNKARKINAKLLSMMGLTIFFIGFLWLGPTIDFLTVLFTGSNLNNEYPIYGLYGYLSYLWTAPGVFFGIYIGAELMIPEKKKYMMFIYLALVVIYEIFLFAFTHDVFIFTYPIPAGSNLIDASIVPTSIVFILMVCFLLSIFVFNGFGFLRKSFQSSGILKKKFLYLALGFILFVICGAFDALFSLIFLVIFIRIGTAISIVLMYLGIRIS